jgi:hypothetical protein
LYLPPADETLRHGKNPVIRFVFLTFLAGCASAPLAARTDHPTPGAQGCASAAPLLAADVEAYLADGPVLPLAPPGRVLAATSHEDLTKQTQNPVAELISVPFQNNFNFGVGPGDDLQYVLNIQPVWPLKISEDWNLITRTILPVVYQPELGPGVGDEFGLGDTTFTGFLSPRKPGKIIWGAGPAVLLPTSTDDSLGIGKWGAGPAAVVLTMEGRWVYGALVNNVWGFEGDYNVMTFQPFVNYNLPSKWYICSGPVITADWEADDDDRWTVPIGGGMGKVFRFGRIPANCQAQIFYNIETPDGGAEWQLRIQFQLLFPK